MRKAASSLKPVGILTTLIGIFAGDGVLDSLLNSFPLPFGLSYATALTIAGVIIFFSGVFLEWLGKRQGD